MKRVLFLLFIAIAVFATNSKATTWFPVKLSCPVCKAKNTYQQIGSYGSYIYSWPSKFQYVYWPLTDNPSVYCCIDCCYSVYMWDFDSIPQTKKELINNALKDIKLSGKYKDYLDVPMTERLEIAEKMYKILERDNVFWSQFYRVLGYHYSSDVSKTKETAMARQRALNLAQMMLKDTAYAGQEKENYYIIAAMYNFTDRKDSALVFLNKAANCTYTNKNWNEENITGFNEYLDKLIEEYKDQIFKN